VGTQSQGSFGDNFKSKKTAQLPKEQTMTRSILAIGLIPMLFACTQGNVQNKDLIEDRQESKGRISVPLTATSTSGELYRVDLPSVTLASVDETIDINMSGQEEIDVSLREGEWSLSIGEGWALYKNVAGEWVEVEAELVSENPQAITIEGGMTTQAVLRFDAEQVAIDFQEGDLNIGIDINDTPTEVDEDQDGFTIEEGDCNDQDATINPDSMDVCDGLDNNCDGEIDEHTEDEIINDGIDQDCDGEDLVLSCEIDVTIGVSEAHMIADINWQVLWYANGERILDTEDYPEISNEYYIIFEDNDYEILLVNNYAAFYDSFMPYSYGISAGTHGLYDPSTFGVTETDERVVSCFVGVVI